MAIYLVAAIDRKDLTTYARYEAEGLESIKKYEVEALAVCDAPELLEGTLPGNRIVLLKFKDRASLERWYRSPEYQKAVPLRHVSGETNFFVAFDGMH
jgi:uncharacterized protein (DUF1330 family)